MRDAIRMRGEVPHARLVAAIEGAIVTVMQDLESWQVDRIAESEGEAETLNDVDAIQIAGRGRIALLWERAVRFAAAAELADMARDLTATTDASARSDEEPVAADEMRRLSLLAVRDILGTTRTAVELI